MNADGNGQDDAPGGESRQGHSQNRGRRSYRHTPENDPNIGAVFGGRYRIEKQIGVGGMGVVYRAVHTGLDRRVVVKLLSRDRLEDDAAVKRFEREAKTLSRLDHSNIVTIYDFGYQDEVSFIVMEYVDGRQLDRFVQEHGGLDTETFVQIASQILDAVGEAHREGLVHRDLKPSNIMLTRRNESERSVKVLDFGLAKLVSGEDDVTKQDSLVGSMPYLSPEQIRGDEIDQRVDVYSLGIVFYFMLTGRKPFRGTNASILYDQVHSDPPPLQLHVADPDQFPHGLFGLVRRCLEKDPDDRFASAGEVLAELSSISDRLDADASGEFGVGPGERRSDEPTQREGSYDSDEASSSELLGRVRDTSDHVELQRQLSEERELGEEPEGEPTQELTTVRGVDRPTQSDEEQSDKPDWLEPRTLVTIASLAVVLGGVVFWFATAPQGPPGESEREEAAPQKDPHPVPQKLTRVDELLDNGEIDRAEKLLESVISTTDNPDRFEEQISEQQRRIHTARLYERARKAAEARNYGEAIDLLEDVVKRAPTFRDAQSRLDELDDLARIRVSAVEGADVRIDGDFLGKAPLETWTEPGRHDIEIVADGYEIWTKPLLVDRGEAISLEPELEKRRAGASGNSNQDDESSGETSNDGLFEGDDQADDEEVSAEPNEFELFAPE